MLSITIPKQELWDEARNEFIDTKETTIQIEHSLVSLSKWEAKWHKPFLSTKDDGRLTTEETIDYIRCMTTTQCVDPDIYNHIPDSEVKKIVDYINDPMTATWFSKDDEPKKRTKEIVTAEIIYYWMIAFQIPVKFEKWHLNRLLTLVEVCNRKNATPKKRSRKEIMERHSALNAARRKAAAQRR